MPDKEGKLNRAVLRDRKKKAKAAGLLAGEEAAKKAAAELKARREAKVKEKDEERKERGIDDFMARYAKRKLEDEQRRLPQGKPYPPVRPEFPGKYTEESINEAAEKYKAGFGHREDYNPVELDKSEYQRAFDKMDDRTKLYSRLLYKKWAMDALRGPKLLGGGNLEAGVDFLDIYRDWMINPHTKPSANNVSMPQLLDWDKLTIRELEDKVKKEEAYMLDQDLFRKGRDFRGPAQGDIRLRVNPFPAFFKEHDKVMEDERKSFRHEFFAGEEEDASLSEEEEETLRKIPRQLGKDSE
tara:strand:+ start:1270 stop:2163 length:894 start_codon:yes stop_codon:yes gene_type:complete